MPPFTSLQTSVLPLPDLPILSARLSSVLPFILIVSCRRDPPLARLPSITLSESMDFTSLFLRTVLFALAGGASRRDLNSHQHDPESCALPIELLEQSFKDDR